MSEELLVNAMLRDGWTSAELHDAVERAVDWIEAHPAATEYSTQPASTS